MIDGLWRFFIDFEGGGIIVQVYATSLEEAMRLANDEADTYYHAWSKSGSEGLGLLFDSETPFSYANLDTVDCRICSDVVETRDDEPVEDFLARLAHNEDDDD